MASTMSRRQMLHTAAAGAVAVGFGNYAAAATKTVKIGLVAPQTGPLARGKVSGLQHEPPRPGQHGGGVDLARRMLARASI